MLERAERRRRAVAYGIVFVVALAHRAMLFLMHLRALDAYIDANASWYTFQLLPREMLRDHLFRSLVLLQQTPPASNLLIGLALRWFSWPVGVAYAMIWMQSVVSILTALVLVHLVATLYPRRVWLWTAIALLFVLNDDLVVLEYTSMGQLIHSPLAMLFSLVVVDRLAAFWRTGALRHAFAAGVATGLLALSRATWSYFGVPCLVLVAVLAGRRWPRAVLACLLPIIALQGSWSFKNWVLYGVFSPATSSWGGMHAVAGLSLAGLRDDYLKFFTDEAAAEKGAPDWEIALAHGDPNALDLLNAETSERDQWVEHVVGLSNPWPNSLLFREFCACGQVWFLRFAVRNPGKMLGKWWTAYSQFFWQPISNFGGLNVAFYVGENRVRDGLDLRDIVRQLRAGTLPEHTYLASGSSFLVQEKSPRGFVPVRLNTLSFLAPLVLMLNVISIHVPLPLVALVWVVQRSRRLRAAALDPQRMAVLLVAAVVYVYLASVANFVETAENMRYRLEVEPVIWVITLICLGELGRLIGAALRRQSYMPSTNHEPVAASR
jgi:hypothetical protein